MQDGAEVTAMHAFTPFRLAAPLFLLALAACGGGEVEADASALAHADGDRMAALALPDATRVAAATATAQSAGNICGSIRPFYWEVGNRDGALASGSITSPSNPTVYKATTPMGIASASKWIYGAYVAQRAGGALSETDLKFLSMRSGYVSLSACERGGTVDGCLTASGNGAFTAAFDGRFEYNSGHMEKHASLIGLGSMNNRSLAKSIQSEIGSDIEISYSQPLLAGGVIASPSSYARFLRKILAGGLQIGSLLGTGAVCTNPVTCGLGHATLAPVPLEESWHYSIGHWVEDDPIVGDGAFSSPGAFGFYPWIDASKAHYGIVARVAKSSTFSSVECGRLIRKAWATGMQG